MGEKQTSDTNPFPTIELFEFKRVRQIGAFLASFVLDRHEIPQRGGSELLDELLMSEDISGAGDYTWHYPSEDDYNRVFLGE